MLHTLPNPQRRSFLHDGSLFLLAAGTGVATLSDTIHAAEEAAPELRFGVITDLHYADKPTAGSRHYRETLAKLADARVRFAQANPEFVVELGDFIDAADSVEDALQLLGLFINQLLQLLGAFHVSEYNLDWIGHTFGLLLPSNFCHIK